MKNILLLNPVAPDKKGYIRMGRCQTQMQPGGNAWPPIDLALIGACVKKREPDCEFLLYDAQIDRNYQSMLDTLQGYHPDICILNCTTPTFYDDIELAREIKAGNAHTFIIFFGLHAITFPHDIIDTDVVDCCVVDEPEEVIPDVCETLFNAGRDALSNVANIVFRSENGKMVTTSKRASYVNFLSVLPDRSLLDNSRYKLQYDNEPFTIVQTSKGCHSQCIYCTSSIYGHPFELRPVASVLEEIKEIVNTYNIHSLLFLSDTFTMDKAWVKELCTRIIEERIEVKWMANSRIDRVDFETMDLMKKAGCWLLSLGIESANDKILKGAKKGITKEQISRAVYILHILGIQTIGYFMFGLPGETKDTIQESIRFSKKLPLDYAYFFFATPFPGTEFYRLAEKNNWLITKDWKQYTHGERVLLRYRCLPARTLKNAVRKAYWSFYLRPSWIKKQLRSIHSAAVFHHYIKAAISILKK